MPLISDIWPTSSSAATRGRMFLPKELAGASTWLQKGLERRDLSAPLALPRAVVTGDFQGYLHFLSPEDGAFVARVNLGSAISATPRAFGGGAIVQTQDGVVALINID